tara:strand:+ start:156 stop:491 length:336 start_codon:yes stop_codon:yes gene_type:complete
MSLIKRTLRVYIAGPMRGYENNNHEAFDAAEKKLLGKRIWDPVNPARVDRNAGVDPSDDMSKLELKEALKRDVDLVFECDSIYMLRGWEKSEGARMEHALAVALSLGIHYE